MPLLTSWCRESPACFSDGEVRRDRDSVAQIRLFAALREAAGRDRDEIEASTVREALEEARRRYGPEFAQALAYASVAVNGTSISQLQGDDTPLKEEDEVAFLPPVSGGTY